MVNIANHFISSLNVSSLLKKNAAVILLYIIQIESFIGNVATTNLSSVSDDQQKIIPTWKESGPPHHDQKNNHILLSSPSSIPEITSFSSPPSMSSLECSSEHNCSDVSSTHRGSNTTLAYTPWQATLIGISAGLLSVVTIAGNMMVMISFKLDKQLQTISNYFLFSLAIADMIVGLWSMPLFTASLIHRSWPYGTVLCDAWLSIDYLASQTSVLNLLVISFDRYFSVTRPLTYRARRTTKRAALMIFSAWAVSAVVWPPWIIAWPYIEGARTVPDNECYIQFIYSNEYMSIVTVIIAFFAPVSVMIGLYVRVWWETVKRQRELIHLQGPQKKVSSKRSDSSDELPTADMEECRRLAGGKGVRGSGNEKTTTFSMLSSGRSMAALNRWRIAGGKGKNCPRKMSGAAPRLSCDSQQPDAHNEITYVPTSALKSAMAVDQKNGSGRGTLEEDKCNTEYDEDEKDSSWDAISRFLCVSCVAAASGTNDPEVSSDGGYLTPRSIETPVGGGHHLSHVGHLTKSSSAYPETGFASSSHQIRDPYASRVPPILRESGKSTKSDGDERNLYTQKHQDHYTQSQKLQQAQNQNTCHQQHLQPHHHNHRHPKCKDSNQQTDSLQNACDPDKADSDNEENSIYTILIRFPPASSTTGENSTSSKRHKKKSKEEGNSSTNKVSNNLLRSKSVHDTGNIKPNQHPHRTSIQMLLESPDEENTPMIRTDLPLSSVKNGCKEMSINTKTVYSKSLPARGRGVNKGIGSGSSTSATTNSSSQRSSQSTTAHNISPLTVAGTPSTPKFSNKRSPVPTVDGNISRIPLDARLVPKQLIKENNGNNTVGTSTSVKKPVVTGSGIAAMAATTVSGIASTSAAVVAGTKKTAINTPSTPGQKPKKQSGEKRNERKAAKTLSAILLAFVVTWTPYSVLTVANAFLGKDNADKYIPGVVWDFSYYLCYINSTVNPVLYALCNAAFRRTYVRILTCRWGGRSRQPYGNRYHYG